MQGLRDSRKLAKREFDLRVGNGTKVAYVAIGTYVLNLPSGPCLNLDNCFYVSVLAKNIILFSYLNKKEFHLNFSNNGYCIMLNDVFYAGGNLCGARSHPAGAQAKKGCCNMLGYMV